MERELEVNPNERLRDCLTFLSFTVDERVGLGLKNPFHAMASTDRGDMISFLHSSELVRFQFTICAEGDLPLGFLTAKGKRRLYVLIAECAMEKDFLGIDPGPVPDPGITPLSTEAGEVQCGVTISADELMYVAHYVNDPYDDFSPTDCVNPKILDLVERGLLERCFTGVRQFNATEKGRCLIVHCCHLPMPIQAWRMPK